MKTNTLVFWLTWLILSGLVLIDQLPLVSLSPGSKLYVVGVTVLFVGWRVYKYYRERASNDNTDPNDNYLR